MISREISVQLKFGIRDIRDPMNESRCNDGSVCFFLVLVIPCFVPGSNWPLGFDSNFRGFEVGKTLLVRSGFLEPMLLFFFGEGIH